MGGASLLPHLCTRRHPSEPRPCVHVCTRIHAPTREQVCAGTRSVCVRVPADLGSQRAATGGTSLMSMGGGVDEQPCGSARHVSCRLARGRNAGPRDNRDRPEPRTQSRIADTEGQMPHGVSRIGTSVEAEAGSVVVRAWEGTRERWWEG